MVNYWSFFPPFFSPSLSPYLPLQKEGRREREREGGEGGREGGRFLTSSGDQGPLIGTSFISSHRTAYSSQVK